MERQRAVAKGDDAQPLEFAYLCYRDYSKWGGSWGGWSSPGINKDGAESGICLREQSPKVFKYYP